MTDKKPTNKIHRYYSQHGEDFIIWNFFNYKDNGVFIDIGAFDGIHLSNSYSFEQMGWRGICIEANHEIFNLCKENRPGSINENVACGDIDADNVDLYVDNSGLFSSTKQISIETLEGHFIALDKDVSIQKVSTQGSKLDNVLLRHEHITSNGIDFVSIDVEGSELSVLKGFDLEKYNPRLLVIETNNLESKIEISSYLKKYNYNLGRELNVNSFYVRSEEDIEKLQQININCSIERQIHPHGYDYTIPKYFYGFIIANNTPITFANIYHEDIHSPEFVISESSKDYISSDLLQKHSILKEKLQKARNTVTQQNNYINQLRLKLDKNQQDLLKNTDREKESIICRENLSKCKDESICQKLHCGELTKKLNKARATVLAQNTHIENITNKNDKISQTLSSLIESLTTHINILKTTFDNFHKNLHNIENQTDSIKTTTKIKLCNKDINEENQKLDKIQQSLYTLNISDFKFADNLNCDPPQKVDIYKIEQHLNNIINQIFQSEQILNTINRNLTEIYTQSNSIVKIINGTVPNFIKHKIKTKK